jgi:hypothetical protein
MYGWSENKKAIKPVNCVLTGIQPPEKEGKLLGKL